MMSDEAVIGTKFTVAVASIFVLAIFGGTIYLTEDQYERALVCENKNWLAVDYYKVSSTNRSVYWIDDTDRNRRSTCDVAWISLDKYLKDNGYKKSDVVKNAESLVPDKLAGCKPDQLCSECLPNNGGCFEFVGG